MRVHVDLKAEALLVAKRAKELGLTQVDLANALSASQSQISRVLSGTGKRRSKLFDELCKYVFSLHPKGRATAESSEELTSALSEVWDGTPQHAKALAIVIRSLGALHSSALPLKR